MDGREAVMRTLQSGALALALALLLVAGHALAAGTPDATAATDRVETLQLAAPDLSPAPIRVRVLLPAGYRDDAPIGYPVLYVNDGQDMEAVGLRDTLSRMTLDGTLRPLIAVAIDMPPDRMAAYGLSDRLARHGLVAQTRYGPVGTQAHAYSEWVAHTLVPLIDARYRTRSSPGARTMLGWSLGALNAFSLGWEYPEVFGRVGAFSPSFWVSADRGSPAAIQRTRLAQRLVDSGQPRNGLQLFFAAGDREETDDRDHDGNIDVLDDLHDLIAGEHDGTAVRTRGLAQLGSSINLDHAAHPDRANVAFYLLPGGEHNQASWARMLPVFLRWGFAVQAPPLHATGTTVSWQELPSAYVPARNVDIWLPPGYAEHPDQRYPVVYMHDGQNLFDPALSYTGVDWGIDETMTQLIAAGRVRPAIVVGVWNTPRRLQEYMPRAAVAGDRVGTGVDGYPPLMREDISSDAYLRFLVEELKPAIDAGFRTQPGRDDTMVMGSSMGGLISAYAIARYPQVFGGAAGLSTHWPIGGGIVIDWLATHLPDPRTHKLYFDHGTATLDAQYAPYQQRMDAALREGGYRIDDNMMSRSFEGAEHSERAWRARVAIPLQFLLGRP
jgi:enterochelin esterase-like enzyme